MSFATLPFLEQLARIDAVATEGDDPVPLLRQAGALPDSEPLAQLVERLAVVQMNGDWRSELFEIAATLPDPALQHLLGRSGRSDQLDTLLGELAVHALEQWPVERISALALMSRWLRRRQPRRSAELDAMAGKRTSNRADQARWLLFVSGQRLVELAREPAWVEPVRDTVHAAIDALARAPKSISQANAEALLARRVYADPGHFFFELLQNADDAGADRWSATVGTDSVVVEHNGAPFSFRDLVGLLSIGQTTKRAEQIGFFGVGFKSVYEICERPRIHSGVFDFEIAHVSIPRLLGHRPEGAKPGDTTLVLPYARPVDVEALHGRAREIPPETLLTLPNLSAMQICGADGQRWTWAEQRDEAIVTLSRAESDEERRYLCAERSLSFSGAREEGRATTSPVLVAVALDADGRPTRTNGPTVFAFLPTAQHTGLRCLVHARFDVTLDRERLEIDSPWNEALLEEAGRGLALAVTEVVRAGHSPLPILSSPSELAPVAMPLAEALRRELASAACLPGADGRMLSPSESRLVEARLCAPLAGLDLGGQAFALAALPARESEVAAFLGAVAFADRDLVEFATEALAVDRLPPPWLTAPVLAALGDSSVSDRTLRELPLLPDGSGCLVPSADAVVAPAEWATLYASIRPMVATRTFDSIPASLRDRLAPAHFDLQMAVSDFLDPQMHAPLTEREQPLLTALSTLTDADLGLLAAAPVLRTASGPRRSIAEGLVRLDPALRSLGPHLVGKASLVAPELEQEFAALVLRWVPALGLPALADIVFESTWDADGTNAVLRVLDAEAASIGRGLANRFSEAHLFADVHGVRRPLTGPGRALLPSDARLVRALPSWPWLAEPERSFVGALDLKPVDAAAVVDALVGDSSTRREDDPRVDDEVLSPVLEWLCDRAGDLPASVADRLIGARVWLDDEGQRRLIDELRRPSTTASIEAFYDVTGIRSTCHVVTARLAEALRAGPRLRDSNFKTVVDDLLRWEAVSELPDALLAELLNTAAFSLSKAELRPVLSLAAFEGDDGTRRPLCSWDEPDERCCHRAGEFRAALRLGRFPLLAESSAQRLEPFLDLVGPEPPTAVDLIRCAGSDAGLLADPGAFREALIEHAAALDDAARSALGQLPIFNDRTGQSRSSSELWSATPLQAAFVDAEIAALGIDELLLDAAQEITVAQIGLTLRPAAELLGEHIVARLRADTALDEQPAPFTEVVPLVRLAKLVSRAGLDVRALPLAVDDRSRVVIGPVAEGDEATRSLVELIRPHAGERVPESALPQFSLPRFSLREWQELVPENLTESLFVPITARQVAKALARACPTELDQETHPVLRTSTSLYEWLRLNRGALESDQEALDALSTAAVLPSQKATLRAPRHLVLDPSVPDLGLGWGIAADVPDDVAAWLSANFELDRRQRRTMVEHVLDGIDVAATADDPARGSELIRFLARVLGAGAVSPVELEERVRYNKVRARLKVPVADRGWEKPRRAWLAPEDASAQVEVFCADVPPRIVLSPLDAPSRALLVACGATDQLDDKTVRGCLDGELLVPGSESRRAFARYIAHRALAEPQLRQEWDLDKRRWVPDRSGKLKRPRDLLWPDDLARSLFRDTDRLVSNQVAYDLPERAGDKLGFRRAATMSLDDLANVVGQWKGTTETLDWLEQGLAEQRFSARDVRSSLRTQLLMRDDEGELRPASELACEGAHELFRSWRGDFSESANVLRLTRALGIPQRPDVAMILTFLAEVSAEPPETVGELAEILPECLERLAEAVDDGKQLVLPSGTIVAGLREGVVRLVRTSDPGLRMFEPAELASALPPAATSTLTDVLPAAGRGPGLMTLMLASGVRDLWSDFSVRDVMPGPEQTDRTLDGKELFESLRGALGAKLGPKLGKRVTVVDPLTVIGSFERSVSSDNAVEATVDAAVVDGTLWLTPAAIDSPELIAVALEPDPQRRVALVRWLAGDGRIVLPKRLGRRDGPATPIKPGFFERIRDFLVGDDEEEAQPSTPAVQLGQTSRARSKGSAKKIDAKKFDEGLFRPVNEVRPQLEGTDGWLERRSKQPDFGFAFTPAKLTAPWVYAPKLITLHYDRRGQSWKPAPLERPPPTSHAGQVVFRGFLPRGEAVLPLPMFGEIEELTVAGEPAVPAVGPSGSRMLHVPASAEVRLRVVLGGVPNLDRATSAPIGGALESFVPDDELPAEVLEFVAAIDDDAAAIDRATQIRDFIRDRYRYDPSYLENPSVGRWLSRLTKGRANAHIAALHAGKDATHLGAGVCYELNSLACELLRRAGVSAAIATGWVLEGGALSEPDHMWCIALLLDARGAPLWVPIDASSTRNGRPLRVPRRPPGRFRVPKDRRAKAPQTPRWSMGTGSAGQPERASRKKKPKRKVPRSELRRVLHHLERLAGHELSDEERAELEHALSESKEGGSAPRGVESLAIRTKFWLRWWQRLSASDGGEEPGLGRVPPLWPIGLDAPRQQTVPRSAHEAKRERAFRTQRHALPASRPSPSARVGLVVPRCDPDVRGTARIGAKPLSPRRGTGRAWAFGMSLRLLLTHGPALLLLMFACDRSHPAMGDAGNDAGVVSDADTVDADDAIDADLADSGGPLDADAPPDASNPDASSPDAGTPSCPRDKLDLLLMVDNSNSMEQEQASLVVQLPRIVEALGSGDHDGDGTPDHAPVGDLHVGVITADMGTGGFRVNTCTEPNFGDDGILNTSGNTNLPGCAATYPKFLSFDPETGDSAAFAGDVSCLSVLGTGGCGFEQQLEAVLKAVTPATSATTFAMDTSGHADAANAGFLRPDSVLALLVLTDEEDCSAEDPELFNESTAIYTGNLNLRCHLYPDALLPVSRYVDGLLATRATSGRVVYSIIAGVPVDAVGMSYEDILDHALMEEMIDPTMPNRLAPSCNVPGRGIAFPPRRMVNVAAELRDAGAHTSVGSICQDDFTSPVNGMLDAIAAALECR